jgi:hypothetical protein
LPSGFSPCPLFSAAKIALALDPRPRIEAGMKRFGLPILTIYLLALAGCSTNQNPTPEQIRQDAAKVTRTAAQDTKAAVQGVVDGLKKPVNGANNTVNINGANADQLQTLPGIDAARARRIIDHRPYDHADDLVSRHIVSQDEYDRISSQVVAH